MITPAPETTLPATSRLWTAQDVAGYLGVPLATLYQWRYLGTGPSAYRVGRHLRYEPAAVQAWLDRRVSRWLATSRDGPTAVGELGTVTRAIESTPSTLHERLTLPAG
jgi:predicted DNA-binding transcriptional regulator AlpA